MDDLNLIEKETKRKRIYTGKILNLDRITVRLPNGREAYREVVLHKGAAAVLPVNERGEAAMVRQYRASLGAVTLEIPAGKLDAAGEDPLDCAIRELKEETGLSAERMKFLVKMHSAAGFCNEAVSIYLATGLSQSEASPDEGEFVNVSWFPLDELYEMALNGGISDSKTLIAILMAKQVMG
ncbi:MAG: NUDIX domain-containing protein [Christensenellales bacterium]|jgi:ADP-ribose pyrophosphatase